MTKSTLLTQVREALRLRHMSLRTEEAYVAWIKRYTCIPHFSERLWYENIAARLFIMRCRHESALQRSRI
jgi:hypothetical protein